MELAAIEYLSTCLTAAPLRATRVGSFRVFGRQPKLSAQLLFGRAALSFSYRLSGGRAARPHHRVAAQHPPFGFPCL